MDKAVVLVSGGMDSAVALYWAAEKYEIAAVLNFYYGQHGAQLELDAASAVLGALKLKQQTELKLAKSEIKPTVNPWLQIHSINFTVPAPNALTGAGGLTRDDRDRYGQPMTFVPGRNLIFIAYATSVAYNLNAKYIIGGWGGIDVDYPDCSMAFLDRASKAAEAALGRNPGQLIVKSPLSAITKAETVTLGEGMGVQWALTRSCYTGQAWACLECDSCKVRLNAFRLAGVRDPLVPSDEIWENACNKLASEQTATEGVDETGGE